MEIIIASILFLPVVVKCLLQKKWYLYLFVSFYAILPDTFAFEISKNLPLITVKRLIILMMLIVWLYKKEGMLSTKYIKIFNMYILAQLFISIINLRYGFGEINRIFILVFERFFPLVMVRDFIEDEEEFERWFDYMIIASMILAAIGIMQTLVGIDVSVAFNLVDERVDSTLSDRMGMVRAKGLFNAIQYGCYCSFIIFIGFYKIINTKQNRYVFCLIINVIALLLSMSRSSIVALGIVFLIFLVNTRKKLLAPIIKYIPIIIAGVIVLLTVNKNILYVVTNVWNSMLKTIGFEVSVASIFGDNADGFISRFMLFSAIPYMFNNTSAIFGLGYDAFVARRIYYYYPMFSKWDIANTLDVGLVAEFAIAGLVGMIATIIFFGGIFIEASNNKSSKLFDYNKFIKYIIGLYLVLNIFSSCMASNIFWILIMMYYSNKKIMDGEKNV